MRSILQLSSSVFAAAFAVLLLVGIAATASNARADEPLTGQCTVGCGCSNLLPPCNDDNCGHGSCPNCDCSSAAGCSCEDSGPG
jgi:hypothetical protein